MGLLDFFKDCLTVGSDEVKEKTPLESEIDKNLSALVQGDFTVEHDKKLAPDGHSYFDSLTFTSTQNPKLKMEIERSAHFSSDAKSGEMFGHVTMTTETGKVIDLVPHKKHASVQADSYMDVSMGLYNKAPRILGLSNKTAHPDPRWASSLRDLSSRDFTDATERKNSITPMQLKSAAVRD